MGLISDKIKRLADMKHGGDINKACAEHFHDYPEDWRRHTDEVTEVKKRAGEDPEKVNAEVDYRAQLIARRDGLDFDKPADRVVAYEKVFAADPDLAKRQRAANSVHVGKVPLMD